MWAARAFGLVFVLVLLLSATAVQALACLPEVEVGDQPNAPALIPGRAPEKPADAVARSVAAFKMAAVLPTGSLGLPGEPIVWVMTATNESGVVLTDLIVSDVLRDELQIDSVEVDRGEAAVSGQMVIVTIPRLEAEESAVITLFTTVRRSPTNGVLANQALLEASGAGGAVSLTATAEIFVPTGLPPTGYPPAGDLPGRGEPSLTLLAALAGSSVALTAWMIYRRGRRW